MTTGDVLLKPLKHGPLGSIDRAVFHLFASSICNGRTLDAPALSRISLSGISLSGISLPGISLPGISLPETVLEKNVLRTFHCEWRSERRIRHRSVRHLRV